MATTPTTPPATNTVTTADGTTQAVVVASNASSQVRCADGTFANTVTVHGGGGSNFSGAYGDLTGIPSNLSTFSGAYDDLTGKPDLSLKLDTTRFAVLNALPGLPVMDPTLAFLPNVNLCTLDPTGRVERLVDPLTGTALTQTTAANRPTMKVDANGLTYLEFRNKRLFATGVNASVVGGPNGTSTSFMFVAKTISTRNNTQFQWSPALASGGFDNDNRIGVHLPWGSGTLYVDHGAVTGGRLQVSGVTNTVGQLVSYLYVRDGGTARLYKDGTLIKTTTGLTAALTSASGRFMLGDDNVANSGYHADMDFYGMFFYPRALTAEEIQKMFLFSQSYFGA